MSSRRQLAAIMFTDIQGYTALMQRNEQIFAIIGPDIRKHPEILLTSGFSPWDTFNDAK